MACTTSLLQAGCVVFFCSWAYIKGFLAWDIHFRRACCIFRSSFADLISGMSFASNCSISCSTFFERFSSFVTLLSLFYFISFSCCLSLNLFFVHREGWPSTESSSHLKQQNLLIESLSLRLSSSSGLKSAAHYSISMSILVSSFVSSAVSSLSPLSLPQPNSISFIHSHCSEGQKCTYARFRKKDRNKEERHVSERVSASCIRLSVYSIICRRAENEA